MKKIILMIGLVVSLVGAAYSQINNWENVRSLPNGQRVVIETMQGKKVHGKFQSAGDDKLSIVKSGKSMTLDKADVKRLYRGKKGKSLLGGIVGGIGGFIAAAIYNQDGRQGDGLEGLAGAVPGAVGGALLGRRVGGGIKLGELVYAAY